MKIIMDYPPNIEKIKAAFNIEGLKVVFTYGDTIYNPHTDAVSDHLMVHESTHARQQGDDPDAWWDKYIADPEFRKEQELEAYANQYLFMKKACTNRVLKDFLYQIANDLSGQIYGNLMSLTEAESAIRRKARDLSECAIYV